MFTLHVVVELTEKMLTLAGLTRRSCALFIRGTPRIRRCLATKGAFTLTPVGDLTSKSALSKGLAIQPVRLDSTQPIIPPVNLMNTMWASPSEDDIHVADDDLESGLRFSTFPLGQEVVSSLKAMGIETAFEIQAKTLPLTLEGKDVIGRAVTGSGKTLAYTLPIVHALSKTPRARNPRAIIITPTRELCNQVHLSFQSLSRSIRCLAMYGGVPYNSQERELRRGVDVICATPGRLNDHLKRGNFALDDIQLLILDEADELLTPNFKMQIENILMDSPPSKQMMLFSATLPPDIRTITKKFMKNPEMVDLVTNRSLVPKGITHEYVETTSRNKMSAVANLLISNKPRKALVFTPTRRQTATLAASLERYGFKASHLNSDMSQRERESCFRSFKRGVFDVLVATDVAARGLDVPEIDLVIQVDIPPNGVDFYIHRSGRTGRKGQIGKTILICEYDAIRSFKNELRRVGINMRAISLPVNDKMVEEILKISVAKINPKSLSKEAMDLAKPHATELTEKYGEDALAAALASMSNLESGLKDGFDDLNNNRRGYQGGGGGGGGGRGNFERDGGSFGTDRPRRDWKMDRPRRGRSRMDVEDDFNFEDRPSGGGRRGGGKWGSHDDDDLDLDRPARGQGGRGRGGRDFHSPKSLDWDN